MAVILIEDQLQPPLNMVTVVRWSKNGTNQTAAIRVILIVTSHQ